MLPRIALFFLICASYQARAEVDLITEPRPGEEYVLVSGGQDQPLRNFETSHKIPEKLPTHHVSRPADPVHSKVKKEKPLKVHSSPLIDALATHKSSVKIHGGEGVVSIEEDKKILSKGHKLKPSEAVIIDVPISKLEEIKIKETLLEADTNPNMVVSLEAKSESGKLSNGSGTTTQKPVLTTARSASASSFDIIPINFDTIDDINSGLLSSNVNLEAAGTEQKQHSRIQIKKGPNGQDYEYEYIYYYYDEDEESPKGKDAKSTVAPVHNSHDGPQKADSDNKIAKNSPKNKSKYSSIERSSTTTTTTTAASTTAAETQNEVLPVGQRNRYRGRNLPSAPAPVIEEVSEERLPASTRFPPRSRNLNTTPNPPEVSSEPAKQRGRAQFDNVADESIGQSRSRTRAHVRRPSSELVDLASFNTHSSGDIPLSQYKDLPSRFSAEGKASSEVEEPNKYASKPASSAIATQDASVGADTPREAHSLSSAAKAQEIFDDSKLPADYKPTTSASYDRETTEYTTMTAMEKVALDLYAYLAGENLNNEINPVSEDLINFDGSTTEFSDEASTTELTSTTTEEATTTTTSTTTTTTTTTTPAPTTTTEAPATSTRASRFKNRNGVRGRVPAASTTTTDAPVETSTKLRGRFNRPSFGAGRGRSSTSAPSSAAAAPAQSADAAPVDEKPVKQETNTLQSSKPSIGGGRARFGGRTRPTTAATTAAPSSTVPASDSASAADHAAPRTRLRPAFHLRERRPLGGASSSTSAAPAQSEDAPAASSVAPSTAPSAEEAAPDAPAAPARGIGRGRLPGLRPLRPGPRLNIGRGASSTSAVSSASPSTESSASEPIASSAEHEETSVETAETTPANSLQRLRGRPRLQVAATAKPKVVPASPIRRPNPLISRRKPATEVTEAAATEASEAAVTEGSEPSTGSADNAKETEAVSHEESAAETTPAPRALSSLLARRRLAPRRPGSLA